MSLEAMNAFLEKHPLVLMEAAIVEQLRRSSGVRLHPRLVNAPLIYEAQAAEQLATLYGVYLEQARRAQLPILLCTPTWRANRERVTEAGLSTDINADAAAFLRKVCNAKSDSRSEVRIGGLLGCRNDCYKPEEALSASEAEAFHAWQIAGLQRGGVDFLLAETLPSVEEALGMARAMAASGLPTIVSFVIGRDGRVLDGTPLAEAIARIDAECASAPQGYMINCAHPSFLCPEQQPATVFERLIGYQANASSLDHCALDQAEALQSDSVEDWGRLMLALNEHYSVKVLGGCCGTGPEHLQYLIDHRKGCVRT